MKETHYIINRSLKLDSSINKLKDIEEKYAKYKQEAIRCYKNGNYDGAYNAFCMMNNLLPPKYRAKLERFKTGYE